MDTGDLEQLAATRRPKPLLNRQNLLRSLLRVGLLGSVSAAVGAIVEGVVNALACAPFGLVVLAPFWLEVWAERRCRDGISLRADAATAATLFVSGLVAVPVALLQGFYVGAVWAKGSPAAAAAAVYEHLVSSPDAVLALIAASVLPAGALAAAGLRRVRRYRPRGQRFSRRALGFAAGAFALMAALHLPAALILVLLTLSLVAMSLLLLWVYAAADKLELEARLWLERRADPRYE